MSTEQNMVLVQRGNTLPSPRQWTAMLDMADAMIKTGLLPTTIKTAAAAVVLIMKGSELGIPPMQALAQIAVINGKPSLGAELMAALIYRDQGDDALQFAETSTERCTVSYKRRTWAQRREFTFSLEDAKRAGLLGGATWTKYPAALLRARCISAVARMAFPDSIGGMYTAEELGAAVTMRDGEFVVEEQPPTPADDADTAELRQAIEAYAHTHRADLDRAERHYGSMATWNRAILDKAAAAWLTPALNEARQQEDAPDDSDYRSAISSAEVFLAVVEKRGGNTTLEDVAPMQTILGAIQKAKPLPDDVPARQIVSVSALLAALRLRVDAERGTPAEGMLAGTGARS